MTGNGDQPTETNAPGFRLRGAENWKDLLRTRSNILLVGPDRAVEAFLLAAADDLLTPVRRVSAAGPLPAAAAGTLVLTDVAALDDSQQQALVAWMDQARMAGAQVFSVAGQPPFTSSTPSAVRLDLYYRLNTIYLELD